MKRAIESECLQDNKKRSDLHERASESASILLLPNRITSQLVITGPDACPYVALRLFPSETAADTRKWGFARAATEFEKVVSMRENDVGWKLVEPGVPQNSGADIGLHITLLDTKYFKERTSREQECILYLNKLREKNIDVPIVIKEGSDDLKVLPAKAQNDESTGCIFYFAYSVEIPSWPAELGIVRELMARDHHLHLTLAGLAPSSSFGSLHSFREKFNFYPTWRGPSYIPLPTVAELESAKAAHVDSGSSSAPLEVLTEPKPQEHSTEPIAPTPTEAASSEGFGDFTAQNSYIK